MKPHMSTTGIVMIVFAAFFCVCMFMDNCSNLPATLIEEGISGIAPSSSEIPLPAESAICANFTLSNIKRHA